MLTAFLIVFSAALMAQEKPTIATVVQEVERINNLRETLVSGVTSDQVDAQTFQQVCAPVGQGAKKTAKAKGWKFRQASHKARNPAHQAQGLEVEAITRFESNKDFEAFWLKKDGKDHYFRRIPVQSACLNCHGPKAKRPDFIKSKYPQDKAFDFKVGDLRGVYHVEVSLGGASQ